MKNLPLIYHPIYSDFPLPEGHRYPLQKYRLLYEHLLSLNLPVEIVRPQPIELKKLKTIHDPSYVDKLINGSLPIIKMRRIGFPWSTELIERTMTSLGGTLLTVEQAIKNGGAIHLTGGYHHAHYDMGTGFCLFNDLYLAAVHALSFENINKVMILDCDVHHGDGTATLTENNQHIVTFNTFCDTNFPSRKPSSTIDLPFKKGTTTSEYMKTFSACLKLACAQYQPDMIIYDAGVDSHEHDELGYLNLCQRGIRQRDDFVMQLAKDLTIPIAAVIGGGYRKNNADLIPLHAELFHAAINTFISSP